MNRLDTHNIQSLPVSENSAATHTVFINDLIVDMMIGVYEHEKNKMQPVRLNINMIVRDHIGPINDDYHNVVCYETVANAIKELAQREHINLVETFAEKIAEICFTHDRVEKAQVKVEKLDAVKEASSVGIEITRHKR